jgi:hypothetical protein
VGALTFLDESVEGELPTGASSSITIAFLKILDKKTLDKKTYTHQVIDGTSNRRVDITHSRFDHYYFIVRIDVRFGLDTGSTLRLRQRIRQEISRISVRRQNKRADLYNWFLFVGLLGTD